MTNCYGHFDAANREYVIDNPRTPAPWINYLLGSKINAFISQAAGGCAWYDEPAHGRLTRYRFNGLPVDSPGFYLYLRDDGLVWNPSYFPVMEKLDSYQCRHGLDYTRFISERNHLQAHVTYFLPRHDNLMLWDVRLKNNSRRTKRVTLYPYMEFSLHGIDKDTYAFLVCGNQYRVYFDRRASGIVVDYFAFEAPFMGKSIFSCTQKVKAFEIDRNRFIGLGRTEANPQGLETGLGNSEAPDGGHYACGVLETEVLLAPGREKRILFKYAVADALTSAKRTSAKYHSPGRADAAFTEIKHQWDKMLRTATVKTPDPGVDALLNTWLPCNCRVTFHLSRSISTRHTGTGGSLRFRDSMQDAMPGVQLFPVKARQRIITILRTMLASGRTVVGVNPKTFNADDLAWTRIDAALWGVLTVYRYLAETGDWNLLNERLPYYDKGRGSVLDHLIRGLRFIGENEGPAGLPRLFDVDWNDMLVLFSREYQDGQSVMVAQQFIYAARLLLEIPAVAGRRKEAACLQAKIRKYTDLLNSPVCWDGKWFKRLIFKDFAMGSRSNRQARIFLNSQSWAAIAGTLETQKVRTAMDSARQLLDTPFGLRLFAPAFTKMADGVTPFYCNTPGAGENGGLFLHANTWAIMAEAMLGNAERAWTYFRRILPDRLSDDNPDRYANEPYAFTSWVYGPDHERFGTGQLSWLTGGAAWIYTVGLEYILGIKPELTGLRIQPCIPGNWAGYSVVRTIRGCRYTIRVENPDRQSGPSVRMTVNGRPIEGNLIGYSREKQTDVRAVLTRSR